MSNVECVHALDVEMSDSTLSDEDSDEKRSEQQLIADQIQICVNALLQISATMKSRQKDMTDDLLPEALRRHGMVAWAELRKLNREMQLLIIEQRKITTTKRRQMEDRLLELNNLKYEKIHIEKEIEKSENFRSLDEDIELVGVEEFYREAPSELSEADVTRADLHRQYLSRLHWELQQRKRFCELKKELLEQIQSFETGMSENSEVSEGIWPKVAAIDKACQPLKESLRHKIKSINIGDLLEVSNLLPGELFNAFSIANSYPEDDPVCSATFFKNNFVVVEDVSMTSGSENSKFDDEESEHSAECSEKPSKLAIHPYSVQLTLKTDGSQLDIILSYVTTFKLVCARLANSEENKEMGIFSSNILDSFDCFLSEAQEHQCYQFEKTSSGDMLQQETRIGRPYRFAHRLCGALQDPKGRYMFHYVIAVMQDVVRTRLQMNKLYMNAVSNCDNITDAYRPDLKLACRIFSIEHMTTDNYKNVIGENKFPIVNIDRCIPFHCKITHSEGASMNLYVALDPGYPGSTASQQKIVLSCHIVINTANESCCNYMNEPNIKKMEFALIRQIHSCYRSDVGMMLYMIKYGAVLFDVYVTSSLLDCIASVIPTQSAFRGRMRELPLYISSNSNSVSHKPQHVSL